MDAFLLFLFFGGGVKPVEKLEPLKVSVHQIPARCAEAARNQARPSRRLGSYN